MEDLIMELNKYIDHTNLKADATEKDIVELCKEAKEYHFASVCINPAFIPVAKRELSGSDVKVCTVIGFPLGASLTATKVFETEDCIKEGAQEIDMVINISKLKDKEYDYVKNEIAKIKVACKDKILKVILECCLLTKEEIAIASKLAKEAGADFVKTSTGFSKWGAKEEDVKLMRETVGDKMGVKAAGGIKDKAEAEKMIACGATRLGTSHGVDIVK